MRRVPRWTMAVLAGALAVAFAVPILAQQGQFQGEVVGKVKNVSADRHQFTVRDPDNRDWTFTLNDATKVQVDHKPGKLGDLKVGARVDVVYSMDGYVPKTIQTLPN